MSYCYVELNIMSAENGATSLYCTLILLFIIPTILEIKKKLFIEPKKGYKEREEGKESVRVKAAEQPTHLVQDKNSNQSRTCTRRGKHVQSTAGLQKSHLYYHNITLSVYVLCVSLCACIRVHARKI